MPENAEITQDLSGGALGVKRQGLLCLILELPSDWSPESSDQLIGSIERLMGVSPESAFAGYGPGQSQLQGLTIASWPEGSSDKGEEFIAKLRREYPLESEPEQAGQMYCSKCDTDTHHCLGCGEAIGHDRSACDACEEEHALESLRLLQSRLDESSESFHKTKENAVNLLGYDPTAKPGEPA